MADRWYVTLKIQMAIDSDMSKADLGDALEGVEVEHKYDRRITFYVPDQVDVEYLEAAE